MDTEEREWCHGRRGACILTKSKSIFLEGDAKEDTILDGPGIERNSETPDFHMYHHWLTNVSDSMSVEPKENGLQVFCKSLFKNRVLFFVAASFRCKDDKEIRYDCTYDATLAFVL